PAYDEKAWQKMEKLLNVHLPQQKDDKRRIIFFSLLLLLIGGGAFLLISKPWNKQSDSQKIVQEKTTKVQPATDEKADNKTISLRPEAVKNKDAGRDQTELAQKQTNKIIKQTSTAASVSVAKSQPGTSVSLSNRKNVEGNHVSNSSNAQRNHQVEN